MLPLIVFVAVMLAVLIPVDMAITRFVPKFGRYSIGSKIPDQFPVLVVKSTKSGNEHKAVIVEYSRLKGYLKSVENYSFTVPRESVEELNKQVAAREDPFGHSRNNGFEVEPLPHGKQRIVVRGGSTMEDRNTGWYIADAHRIKPEYHQNYYSGEKAFYTAPYMLGAVCLAWYIAWRFSRHLDRRQAAGVPVQE